MASLLGCGPAPGTPKAIKPSAVATGAVHATPVPLASAPISAGDVAGIISQDAAGIVSRDGAGLIGHDGASITGVASLPAGIVSRDGAGLIGHDGASLIGHDGASLIGHDGASYRALALPDAQPLRQQLVYLMTAGGQLVAGEDGKPMTATTDADGRFGFQGFVNQKNLVLAIKLYDDKGFVKAILPHGDAAMRTTDLGLASTLTATYIQEKFVKSQADPVATLDRLPGDVEASTQAVVGDAAGGATLPKDLNAATVVGLVDQLRGQVPALAKSLDDVKVLLLGQANLGTGRQATAVPLLDPRATAPDGKGGYFIAEGTLGRIRRVAADGTLSTYADQLRGDVKASFFGIVDLATGPDGSLYVASSSDGNVSRIKPDGSVSVVAGTGTAGRGTPGQAATSVALRPQSLEIAADGTLWIGETRPADSSPRVLTVGADGIAREPAPVPQDWYNKVVAGLAIASDKATYALVGTDGAESHVYRLKPGATSWEQLSWPVHVGYHSDLIAAPDGGLFMSEDGTGRVQHIALDGTIKLLEDRGTLGRAMQLCATADGGVRVVDGLTRRVFQLAADGTARAIAGTTAATASGDELALDGPFGVAFDQAGTMFVSQTASNSVERWTGSQLVTVAGGIQGRSTEGTPVSAARFNTPSGLTFQGTTLDVVDRSNGLVVGIGADGFMHAVAGGGLIATLTAGFPAAASDLNLTNVTGVATAPDGSLFLATANGHQVLRVKDGQATLVAGSGKGSGGDGGPAAAAKLNTPAELAFGPDGSLYVADAGNMRIRRIQDPTGPNPTIEAFAGLDGLAAFAALSSDVPAETTRTAAAFAFPAGLCVDAAGNVYVAEFGTLSLPLFKSVFSGLADLPTGSLPKIPARIRKITPDGKVTVLAGPGGKFFADSDADDGLILPTGLSVDPKGRLVIVDAGASLIRFLAAGSY